VEVPDRFAARSIVVFGRLGWWNDGIGSPPPGHLILPAGNWPISIISQVLTSSRFPAAVDKSDDSDGSLTRGIATRGAADLRVVRG
jgi:hypothetical protein